MQSPPPRSPLNAITITSPLTLPFKTFTAHATLPKGGAALPNLRIPILPSKTIVFPTPKTLFRLLSKLEAGLYLLVPPLFCGRGLGKRGPSLQAKHGQEYQNHHHHENHKTSKYRLFLGFSSIESKSLI